MINQNLLETKVWNWCLLDRYVPVSYVIVAKQLFVLREQGPFREYTPLKLGKYGIKYLVCVLSSYKKF